MEKREFLELIEKQILILDGATGTELQKKGMPSGVCPEKWVIENPQTIKEIQKNYINSGSNVVYSCTFGGNRIKLSEFGMEDRVVEFNETLARLSKEAVGNNGYVAGDLAPTGQFIYPLGDLTFEEIVDVYKEQVSGLIKGGVDFFVIETMMDIQEARAALLAVKESCNLPVFVSMTFDENKRTLTGTNPISALVTLQSLGADAVGCNCSTGPKQMLEVIKLMKPYAKVPLLAKPNAGLPKLVDGKTIFEMEPSEFGSYVKDFVEAGVNLFGGCCGTSPKYIEMIKTNIAGLSPKNVCDNKYSILSSSRKAVEVGFNNPVSIVGERINPTGKKQLQAELRENNDSLVREFA